MKTTVLGLVCFVASTLPLRAQPADASGTWDFTVTTQQGPTTAVMTTAASLCAIVSMRWTSFSIPGE